MPNMDIADVLHRRGNVILVKRDIGSTWENGLYNEPLCHSYRMIMVSYFEPLVPILNHWFNVCDTWWSNIIYNDEPRMNHGLETID